MIATTCRSCESAHLEVVLSLGSTPLANALLSEEQLVLPEPRYPLDLAFCRACTLVQITETVPPAELFGEYLYFSSYSDTMLEHAEKLVKRLIPERRLGPRSLVIEIASNDGYLLQFYRRHGIPVLGIEPARNVARAAEERGVPTLCDFFGPELGRSLRNLGVECIDVYYLHNPESQLSEVSRPDFLERVRDAFIYLESAAAAGKIQFYGMATWNGFRQEARARDAMQLAELATLAHDIAGDKHRFRFVQLPFNLGMTEALTLGNQSIGGKDKTVMEAATELDITLMASASLLQGQVARNLPAFVGEALGLEDDAQRSLQFVRSSPGITTALVGMSHVEHVRANAKLVGVAPATVDQFSKLFTRGERA